MKEQQRRGATRRFHSPRLVSAHSPSVSEVIDACARAFEVVIEVGGDVNAEEVSAHDAAVPEDIAGLDEEFGDFACGGVHEAGPVNEAFCGGETSGEDANPEAQLAPEDAVDRYAGVVYAGPLGGERDGEGPVALWTRANDRGKLLRGLGDRSVRKRGGRLLVRRSRDVCGAIERNCYCIPHNL